MTVNGSRLDRRTVLKATSGAVAGAAISGVVAADSDDRVEVTVGVRGEASRSAARDAADRVRREFPFGALSLEVRKGTVERLAGRDDIRYVEETTDLRGFGEDEEWTITQESTSTQTTDGSESITWGLERIGAEQAWADGVTGDGVDVAVLDSGISPTHDHLADNVGGGYVPGDAPCDDDCTPFYYSCDADWDDDYYDDRERRFHGTHVAGTVGAVDEVGVAPDVTLHAVKTHDCRGVFTNADVAEGITWCVEEDHDVLNLSFGSIFIQSEVIEDAIEYATENDVVLVASAGNAGCGAGGDCVGFPASHPDVIAVSAVDRDDEFWENSSSGPAVDIAAPGVDVRSTTPIDDFMSASGTSMAAPHVAGAAALLVSDGHAPETVRDRLKETADDVGLADSQQGAGRLNVAAALDTGDDGDGTGGDGTDDGDDPTIETYEVTDESDRFTVRVGVDWAVTASANELETVTLELIQREEVVDDVTHDLEGPDASGSDELTDRFGGGTYDVTCTVTDTAGNETVGTVTTDL